MAYPRKRYNRRMARKGPRRGYRTYRKSIIRKRQIPQSYKGVSSLKRSQQLSTITVGAAAQNPVYTFSIDQLPNYTEITNLYDMYKIKCVVLKFVPLYTSADVNPLATGVQVLPIHTVIDNSDKTALTSVQDAMEYSTYKMTRGLSIHTRKVYPKQLQFVDDGGVATLGDIKTGWIRSESPGVDHLGVKAHIPAATAASVVYQVFATYYIQVKQSK